MKTILDKIRACAFAKCECEEFLDTHPDNAQALTYYRECTEKLAALTAEYEDKYGPLTAAGVKGNFWSWIDGPWPWQNGKADAKTDCRGVTKED